VPVEVTVVASEKGVMIFNGVDNYKKGGRKINVEEVSGLYRRY